jgi:hypothetical protein
MTHAINMLVELLEDRKSVAEVGHGGLIEDL